VRFELESNIREIRGFRRFKSLGWNEIPALEELLIGFHCCRSLTDIIFENTSRIREIDLSNPTAIFKYNIGE
jgi:hypothetical protein